MSREQATSVIVAAAAKGVTIATAESCTGGMIAAALTDVAGSSAVFDRGFVTYSNWAKSDLLGVPIANTEGEPGAVSELVAQLMAEGARTRAGTDLAIAVTGIAGPGGGSEKKPVGLVYLAVADSDGTQVRECRFAETHGASDRDSIRKLTVETALEMLEEAINRR